MSLYCERNNMLSQKTPKLSIEIAHQIKTEIVSGRFNSGDCIPSERTLIKLFKVSLVTIRRSLHELVNEGLLVNKMGRGYFLPTNAEFSQKRTIG